MPRFKTLEQLETERRELARYAIGSAIQWGKTRLLLIYARQSTDKQYFKSSQNSTEQRSELERVADTLQWPRELVRVLVENDYAKKGKTSGTISIALRPALNEIYNLILSGKVGALLVVDVSRLSRDEDLIDAATIAQACKNNDTYIITAVDSYIYDFRHPTKDDLKKFNDEAYIAAQFIKRNIKGKMLKARTEKANGGKVANGNTPIGLTLNATRDGSVPTPHAAQV